MVWNSLMSQHLMMISRVRELANERTDERSGARERSESAVRSKRMREQCERTNGRVAQYFILLSPRPLKFRIHRNCNLELVHCQSKSACIKQPPLYPLPLHPNPTPTIRTTWVTATTNWFTARASVALCCSGDFCRIT